MCPLSMIFLCPRNRFQCLTWILYKIECKESYSSDDENASSLRLIPYFKYRCQRSLSHCYARTSPYLRIHSVHAFKKQSSGVVTPPSKHTQSNHSLRTHTATHNVVLHLLQAVQSPLLYLRQVIIRPRSCMQRHELSQRVSS